MVRFHFEAFIPKEHDYLMLNMEDEFYKLFNGVKDLLYIRQPILEDVLLIILKKC